MKSEFERRQSYTANVVDFFRAHPGQWLRAVEFEPIGGRQAWRSRIAEARRVLAQEGGTVTNRCSRMADGTVISEYCYLPQAPIGRDAARKILPTLF